jgi:predicted transcriptional regulator
MEKTTIQISSNTLERLKSFKKYDRQSYDNLLNYMFDEIQEESLSKEEINEIQQALEDIKKGNIYPIEEVAKELGILLK